MIVELWLCVWMWLRLCVLSSEWVCAIWEVWINTTDLLGRLGVWNIGISYVVSLWRLRHLRKFVPPVFFTTKHYLRVCFSNGLDWNWVDFVAGLLWWPHNPSIVRTITYARYKSKPDYPHLPFFGHTTPRQGNVGANICGEQNGQNDNNIYSLTHEWKLPDARIAEGRIIACKIINPRCANSSTRIRNTCARSDRLVVHCWKCVMIKQQMHKQTKHTHIMWRTHHKRKLTTTPAPSPPRSKCDCVRVMCAREQIIIKYLWAQWKSWVEAPKAWSKLWGWELDRTPIRCWA